MIEKLNEDERLLMECLMNPMSATECLFSELENLTFDWDNDRIAHIRSGQIPMLSFEHLIDDDPRLSYKDNFQLKVNAGTIDCFSGRNIGKSHLIEVVDILLCVPWLDNMDAGFSSVDSIHIRAILEDKLIPILDKHPFYKDMLKSINRSPNYKIAFKNGFTIIGINMNAFSTQPGKNFLGKHLKRLYIEEASLETEEVFNKRQESKSDIGCVIRSGGMTDFIRFSPAGKRFYAIENQPWVCNLPIFINPNFQEKEKQEAIKKYGGENSYFYRVYCKAEIVEDAITVIDMERIKGCYLEEEKHFKHFEINKSTFHNFKDIIVVDRYKSVDEVWVCADIGESAPTEIMIFFKNNQEKFKYAYRITLLMLTDKEQYEIFKFLGNKLNANIISLDSTDGQGRAILRRLEEIFPKQNLHGVAFNEKIKIDFKRDEKGNVVFDDKGLALFEEEYVAEWSVKILKEILYDTKVLLPLDYTLIRQLNGLICFKSGNRLVYEVKGGEDHILSAFRVFAITFFLNEFKRLMSVSSNKKFSKTGV